MSDQGERAPAPPFPPNPNPNSHPIPTPIPDIDTDTDPDPNPPMNGAAAAAAAAAAANGVEGDEEGKDDVHGVGNKEGDDEEEGGDDAEKEGVDDAEVEGDDDGGDGDGDGDARTGLDLLEEGAFRFLSEIHPDAADEEDPKFIAEYVSPLLSNVKICKDIMNRVDLLIQLRNDGAISPGSSDLQFSQLMDEVSAVAEECLRQINEFEQSAAEIDAELAELEKSAELENKEESIGAHDGDDNHDHDHDHDHGGNLGGNGGDAANDAPQE